MHLPSSKQFYNTISAVIDPSISKSAYVPIDLSVTNTALQNVNTNSSDAWEEFINNYLSQNEKKVAYGGYLEKRNLYQRSAYFQNAETDRNIHLGVDFWVDAGTSVHAICDGMIHSFQDNQNHGDYGPTIILAHETEGVSWYSLYGHLSRESLKTLEVGKRVRSGEAIATLGDASVNGDYAPHLHFQLIMNLEGKTGDYPGVCAENQQAFYSQNCPNPLPLFELE